MLKICYVNNLCWCFLDIVFDFSLSRCSLSSYKINRCSLACNYLLFLNHQDIDENSSDPAQDLHMSLEELYAQSVLQRHSENPASVDMSVGSVSGFAINDYSPENLIEQYGHESTVPWTASQLPSEVLSSAELTSVVPDSAGKVIL